MQIQKFSSADFKMFNTFFKMDFTGTFTPLY